jgi:hypothetical protein
MNFFMKLGTSSVYYLLTLLLVPFKYPGTGLALPPATAGLGLIWGEIAYFSPGVSSTLIVEA